MAPLLKSQRRSTRVCLLLGVALLAALDGFWQSIGSGYGANSSPDAFVMLPSPMRVTGPRLYGATSAVHNVEAPQQSSNLPVVGATGVLLACVLRAAGCARHKKEVKASDRVQPRDESLVAMAGGGRRKRLGVPGRICMLTGRKTGSGFYRTFCLKKVKKRWRPNLYWKKFWWEREKKWIRLKVSCKAIKKVDRYGLEAVANRAGLDLHAWSKPSWEPGSQQPLKLKVGVGTKVLRDKKWWWPEYSKHLNKGKTLAECIGLPDRRAEKKYYKGVYRDRRMKSQGLDPKEEALKDPYTLLENVYFDVN